MIKKPQTKIQQKKTSLNQQSARFSTKIDTPKSVLDHIHELRSRLMWSVLALLLASSLGYVLHSTLVHLMQKPLGQQLYFTSPAGGLNFIIKICLTFGFVVSLPVLLFQAIKFFFPLLEQTHKKAIIPYTFCSILLAYTGVVFAYIVSLPSALYFLSHFGGDSIVALITVDEYYNFVLAYLAGFAVLFQLPIIIMFINRIKPLKPGRMMKAQRYIILGSFVVAAILTPTPDPINQAMMAMPAIILYQVGVVMVWLKNRKATYHIEPNYAMNVSSEFAQNLELEPTEEPVAQQNDRPLLNQVDDVLNRYESKVIENITKRNVFVQDVIAQRSRPSTEKRVPQLETRYQMASSRLIDIVV